MPWIPLKRLDFHNCFIHGTHFVKSMAKRPREANVNNPNYKPIIIAALHAEHNKRKIHRKQCWNDFLYSGMHFAVYLKDNELYSRKGRKFENPWLRKQILKKVMNEHPH